MTPVELLLVMLGAAGAGGWSRLWWVRRARRDFVNRIRAEWVRAGQVIQFGPVSAVSYGNRPHSVYARGVFGVLGRTDGRVVFEGDRSNVHNTAIPLDRVRWISLSTIAITARGRPARQRALSIHYDSSDGWRVSTFVLDAPVELARQISRECDLPVHDTGSESAGYGPSRATRMIQDVYGEWSADREGDLYLAPDRLLFDWRHAIPLDTIRRIDVLTQGSDLNPLAVDLLRIESDTPDGVTGFALRRAQRWADAIAQRSADPLLITTGRKKKA